MAGGSSTAITEYPPYIEDFHSLMLVGKTVNASPQETSPYHAVRFLGEAWDQGSPFLNAVAYDPSSDVNDMNSAVQTFADTVGDMDVTALFDTLIDAVAAKANEVFSSEDTDTYVQDQIQSYEEKSLPSYLRDVSMLSSGLFEGDLADGSALKIGLAILNRGRVFSMQDYGIEIKRQQERTRGLFVTQAFASLLDYELKRIGFTQTVTSMQIGVAKDIIVAGKEFTQEELEYAFRGYTANLELFQFGGQVLGSINGIPMTEKGPSKAATALSSGLNFAAMGVQLGSAAGVPGAAIGGIIGLIGGSLAGSL